MPGHRPTYPIPPVGAGAQRLDQVLRNQESHQEQMREELELQHQAAEGRSPGPGLTARIRALFRRT